MLSSSTPPTSGISQRFSERVRRHRVPASVFFTLTERCHLRCQQCYLVEDPRDELSLDEVKDALDQLAAMGAVGITFTGGEALLRPDIYDILRYASQKGFVITLFTSGTPCNPDRAQKIKEAGAFSVSVTLYSAEPAIHDAITQIPGAWQKTVEGLRHLKEAGLRTEVKFLQMIDNIGQLIPTRELAATLGARFVVDFKVTATHDGRRHPLKMQAQEEQLAYFYHQMAERDPSFAQQLAPKPVNLNAGVCGAGSTRLVIGSDGQIYPCMDYIPSLGSLREQPIAAIWENQAVQNVREIKRFQDPICQVCPDKAHCSFCPSTALLDTGDPTKPSASLCLLARTRRRVYEERMGLRPRAESPTPALLATQKNPPPPECLLSQATEHIDTPPPLPALDHAPRQTLHASPALHPTEHKEPRAASPDLEAAHHPHTTDETLLLRRESA